MRHTQPFSGRSRINPIAVISGVMMTLAAMLLCMSLAAALGFWLYRPDELPLLGPSFWSVASVAWTVSVFLGSLWVAMASHSVEMKNGIMNSVTA